MCFFLKNKMAADLLVVLVKCSYGEGSGAC